MQVMQEGQTIKHDLFGLGIVTASDPERTAVDFDDHGPKLFVTSMLSAEMIGEAGDAVEMILSQGIEAAMNKYNQRKLPPSEEDPGKK